MMRKISLILITILFLVFTASAEEYSLDSFMSFIRDSNVEAMQHYVDGPIDLYVYGWHIDRWPDKEKHVIHGEDLGFLFTETQITDILDRNMHMKSDPDDDFDIMIQVSDDYGYQAYFYFNFIDEQAVLKKIVLTLAM